MLPIIGTPPTFPVETGGLHQRPQQCQGQGDNKENAESPTLRGKQFDAKEEEQQPQPRQQRQQGQEHKQQGPARFPPSSSTTTYNTIPTPLPSSSSSSSSSFCPNLEGLVDTFFAQARCKFVEQFDEMANTTSRTMKNEIVLRTEQERRRRAEWEVSVVDALNKELNELRASRDQLTVELDMLRMPMMDTPSPLKSGMLFMSGRNPNFPCANRTAEAQQPLTTPASRLSLFSLSSASGAIDATSISGKGMSPSPCRGLFPAASGIKLAQSPLTQQPPQLQLQAQPEPLPSPLLLASEAPAVDMATTTTPVSSRPATPSSVYMAGARAAAFEGARLSTGNDEIAAAAAAAAQSTWLATYYSSKRQSIPSDAPAPTAASILAPDSSVAFATPAAFASSVDVPSTSESVMATVDEHHPTEEITADVSEPVYQPEVVKTVTSPPVVAVTNTAYYSVPDGCVPAKARDVPGFASPTSTAIAAATKPKATPPSFVARSLSAGRRPSMPVGGESRQRISGPAGLPFTILHDDMPPPEAHPQPKTPRSAMKSPMRFSATPGRSPLGTLNVNTVNPRVSSNIVGMKKAAGNDSAGRSDGGFGATPASSTLGAFNVNTVNARRSSDAVGTKKAAGNGSTDRNDGGRGDGRCVLDGGSIGDDDKHRIPPVKPAVSHDRRKAIETVRQGVRYESPTASRATKRVDGDGVDASKSPRKGNGSITIKQARKMLPHSQRVLRSATRASRAAEVSATQVATATKRPSRRASAIKTTLPASTTRTTRLATLRSAGRASGSRGTFMKF